MITGNPHTLIGPLNKLKLRVSTAVYDNTIETEVMKDVDHEKCGINGKNGQGIKETLRMITITL